MNPDRPDHLERLQTAIVSRDLRQGSSGRTDADYLTAAGYASRRTGLSASMHLRLTSSAAELRRAGELVGHVVDRLNAARRWGLSAKAVKSVIETALVHHLEPACKHCSGRGNRLIPGTPVKSGKPCPHCRGSGRHPIPHQYRDQVEAVLFVLRDADERIQRQVHALMR